MRRPVRWLVGVVLVAVALACAGVVLAGAVLFTVLEAPL